MVDNFDSLQKLDSAELGTRNGSRKRHQGIDTFNKRKSHLHGLLDRLMKIRIKV